MTIYEAITEMRKISKAGGTFAITFMSYSIHRDQCHGIIEVNKARLRKRASTEHNQFAELQEYYVDVNTGEPRRFWHCCLLSLNGQSLTFIAK
ncbi:hypothetical protein HP439_14735 [Sphingobacterium shayense]|uniref:hypothetical protein n=1 Tax=Sphingobacterium shayense TaxID=626343 RepID=UPI0015539E75|nr:hypothetical protein [Sphingobacterium shayense]NQD71980.1 hypothetical protein [Sphingobacterium shayense]